MSEGKVAGYLFEYSFAFIHRHWGQNGIEKFSYHGEKHISERWYPLNDFCELLSEIHKTFSKEKSMAKRLGYESVVGDIRWRSLFKGKDPAKLLLSTENQDSEFLCGDSNFKSCGEKEVEIQMSLWIDDVDKARLWCDYYGGRLLGVLELTGHKGEVDTEFLEGKKTECTHHVRWK